MATILIKRGLETNRLAYTPSTGEVIWTTDNEDLWIGDGATAGGIKVTGNVESSLTTNYYTQTQSDTRYVQVAGDTMTGFLTLSANPTNNLHAATKQYVDGMVDSNMKSPDGYATVAAADYPTNYKATGSVHEGDTFYITSIANGTLVGTETVNTGDLLVALVDTPGNTTTNWTIVESNRDSATETVQGVVELATQAEVDAGIDAVRVITPATLAATTNINNEAVEDIVGGMLVGVQNGITVTYDDPNGELDFDVDDFSITLTGAATGSGTVTNLANVSFATSISSLSVIDDVFTAMAPNNGEVLTWDNANSRWDSSTIPSGVTTFAALTDTPANYIGSADQFLKVNAGGTAVEFTDTIDGGTF